ncbi:dephospho-CoA kinase [Sphingomonas sp. PR090111-T3T-6A]|uniref:dephospho-CoA kinase n=1 Tax=Sphingomonas sp. PR090111-T3T-6A TaxID=685778 RepID=UPI00035F48D9|nr:dephospho-CoA kinase [Sphingomonas sp. PR090111-T3T-6A]
MILIGLTGSIGMGKSTVAGMFRAAGVPVFDADATVHRLQGPGGALLPAIEAAFPGTTGPRGVDRAALGRAVFGNRAALRRLEAIVHPAVARARADFLRRHRAHRIVVDDVPLLFETGGDRRVDAVVVVSAPAWVQRRRVLARPGMTQARFADILARQMPAAEKRRRADFVLPTGVTRVETRAKLFSLIACLRAHGIRYCRSCVR